MQKYKIVASKSQKKYTIIVSADSESQAKEKLHKEDYSILSIAKISQGDIEGLKFIFQVEHSGNIKNGIIIGKDIFKVYIKLRVELGYNVIFLYPEGDEAHNNAEKKQKIMHQLEQGFKLQEEKIKTKSVTKNTEENFFIQKQLIETYELIERVLVKMDIILTQKKFHSIDDITFQKIQTIYEGLIHMKKSTNIAKLREIGELALIKIAEIELKSVEKQKNIESRKLLKDTNKLLKEIGSNKQFIEADKDIKKIITDFFSQIQAAFVKNEGTKEIKNKKLDNVDTKSYSFLKTILLLEKYTQKLSLNSKEIKHNLLLFLNPFSKSEIKEKILLKRKVIQQNISILKAKKNGNMSSYTGIKKGYHKTIEKIVLFFEFLSKNIFFMICIYSIIYLFQISYLGNSLGSQIQNGTQTLFFLFFFFMFFFFTFTKNIFLLGVNVVFFLFIFIFSIVNF